MVLGSLANNLYSSIIACIIVRLGYRKSSSFHTMLLNWQLGVQVDNLEEANLVQRLVEAKLTPPSIVKPQIACGVADAHRMVIIYLLATSS